MMRVLGKKATGGRKPKKTDDFLRAHLRVVRSSHPLSVLITVVVFLAILGLAQQVEAAPPVADFSGSPTTGVEPLAVTFTDLSTQTPTSWSWDFDNDGTENSTLQNPSYTYNTAGTYTVSLSATNGEGSDTETKIDYITVNDAPPVVDFSGSPTSGVGPLAVNFTDATTGNVTTWSWDFDNDGTEDATAQNPAYTYVSAGT
jgi:PKD repeat protein